MHFHSRDKNNKDNSQDRGERIRERREGREERWSESEQACHAPDTSPWLPSGFQGGKPRMLVNLSFSKVGPRNDPKGVLGWSSQGL